MHDVTFLVKTFERPECFRRCVQSIYAHHPGASLVVVEDSLTPYARELALGEFAGCPISVFELPPDQGISAGRNFGIARIQTPYFALLDDDHELRSDSDVAGMRETLVAGNWDIVGGTYVHYDRLGRPFSWSWEGYFRRVGTVLICQPLESEGRVMPCDIVNNFFIARTESVKAMGGWDPALKVLEHVDFFLRAQQKGIRVAHLPGSLVDHRIVRDPHYSQFRIAREQVYRAYWMRKHGISHFITFEGKVYCIPALWPGNQRSLPT